MKISFEIDNKTAELIKQIIKNNQGEDNTHGPLTIEILAAMLFEDIALTIRRPGSWEGYNMAAVLTSHGYDA